MRRSIIKVERLFIFFMVATVVKQIYSKYNSLFDSNLNYLMLWQVPICYFEHSFQSYF